MIISQKIIIIIFFLILFGNLLPKVFVLPARPESKTDLSFLAPSCSNFGLISSKKRILISRNMQFLVFAGALPSDLPLDGSEASYNDWCTLPTPIIRSKSTLFLALPHLKTYIALFKLTYIRNEQYLLYFNTINVRLMLLRFDAIAPSIVKHSLNIRTSFFLFVVPLHSINMRNQFFNT
jgi:hypothetical protein